MKRQEFEHELQKLHCEHVNKLKELNVIQTKIVQLKQKEGTVLEEHALIPKRYKTIEEWLDGHPYPSTVNSMRFNSYNEAFSVSLCCYTYQYEYHIVKTGK